MKSAPSVRTKRSSYGAFSGLNTAQADIALEALLPARQAALDADNVLFSRNGWVSNERALVPFGFEQGRVIHARWYSAADSRLAYAVESGSGVSIKVTDGVSVADAWPVGSAVTSCVFRRKTVFACRGQVPMVYDGSTWQTILSPQARGASFCCSVQNRLVLSGFSQNPTEILVSRVNDETVMPDDEAPGDASVIKAFRFNIANLLGTSDVITGVAAFESNKLAIFTNDRVLIYVADEDLTRWTLDDKVTINIGTVSHNSIAGSVDELLFASRRGVHSVRRSVSNGTTMFTLPMSEDISELYQSLFDSVVDKTSISAWFDQDEGRYHVCFRHSDASATRLSVALSPAMSEGGASMGSWTRSSLYGCLCGDSLAGNVAVGTIGGIRKMLPPGAVSADRGEGWFTLPLLWQGDINNPKQSASISVISSGYGRVICEMEDETERQLGSVEFDIPAPGTVGSYGPPSKSQFERFFEHVYVGVKMRVRILSEDQLRIFAISVNTREM